MARGRPPRRPPIRLRPLPNGLRAVYDGQLQFSDGAFDNRDAEGRPLLEDGEDYQEEEEDDGASFQPPLPVEAYMQILTPQGYLPEVISDLDGPRLVAAEEEDYLSTDQQQQQLPQQQQLQNNQLQQQQQQPASLWAGPAYRLTPLQGLSATLLVMGEGALSQQLIINSGVGGGVVGGGDSGSLYKGPLLLLVPAALPSGPVEQLIREGRHPKIVADD